MLNINLYNIKNLDNYKTLITVNNYTIYLKYNEIIYEYFKLIKNNIYIDNINYKKFIIKKGINSITNIFKLLFINTKNLDLVFYHSQKSSIYFIEFINQICDENNTFLQLNTKDASLFVYKKTIFDLIKINNMYNLNNNKIIHINNIIINIYNIILFKIINHYDDNNLIKIIEIDINRFFNLIFDNIFTKTYNYSNNNIYNLLLNKLEVISIFVRNINIEKIFILTNHLIKKIKNYLYIDIHKFEYNLFINNEIFIDINNNKSINNYITNITNNIIDNKIDNKIDNINI